MKIGLISDTHGHRPALEAAVKAVGTVALWLHAGDYSQDAALLAKLSGVEVVAARGNCDGMSQAKPDEFVAVGGKKLWLTHGHRYHVRGGSDELAWWAKEFEVDAAVYGHTHIGEIRQVNGIWIINPGSAAMPRDNLASCAVLTIGEGGVITVERIALDVFS